MHADAFLGQPQKPFHRGPREMGATRRRINPRANARADDTTGGIDEIAVEIGVMIGVFFQHFQVAGRRAVAAFAR